MPGMTTAVRCDSLRSRPGGGRCALLGAFLSSMSIAAACSDDAGQADPVGKPLPCEEGATECRGQRKATCRNGEWEERACDLACQVGHCVECNAWEQSCVDGERLVVCENGRFVEVDCGGRGCWEGACRCQPGAARCSPRGREVCTQESEWRVEACPGARPICQGGQCLPCIAGTTRCVDDKTVERCDLSGGMTRVYCTAGCNRATGKCLDVCNPGARRCIDASSVGTCNEDGVSFDRAEQCDVDGGERCMEGVCTPTCPLAEGSQAPYGCHFVSAVFDYPIAEMVWAHDVVGNFPIGSLSRATALYVVNIDPALPVLGTFRDRDGAATPFVIPPAGSDVVGKPLGISVYPQFSRRVPNGTVTVSTNRPVHVITRMEGTPESRPAGTASESGRAADTDFLMPSHLVQEYGKRYRVITTPMCRVAHHPDQMRPGGFTIASASSEPAVLNIHFFGPTSPGEADLPPAYPAGVAAYVLEPDEVVHFHGTSGDLTGSLVESDRPFLVFTGGISRVPCLENYHIQAQPLEQLTPVGLWSLAGTGGPGGDVGEFALTSSGSVGTVRWVVVTDEPANTLTIEPPPEPGDSNTYVLAAGGDGVNLATRVYLPDGDLWDGNSNRVDQSDSARVTLKVEGRIHLRSDRPALVGRYTTQSFAIDRPSSLWRSRYWVVGGGNALLTVHPGARVVLNGEVVSHARTLLPSGHEALEMSLIPDVVNEIMSDTTFGILARFGGFYSGPVGFPDGFAGD